MESNMIAGGGRFCRGTIALFLASLAVAESFGIFSCGIPVLSKGVLPASNGMSWTLGPSRNVQQLLRLATIRDISRLRGGRMTAETFSEEKLAFSSTYISATGNPRSFANWILPGKVMLGRYPSGTPIGSKTGTPSRKEGLEHIRRVMNEGVSTFVCLQQEVPPQEKGELWPADGMMQLPDPELRAKYPMGFIRYYEDCQKIASEQGVPMPSFIHFPIPDFSTPDMDKMIGVIEGLAETVRSGKGALYVHCWGGRGRAGTIGACLYMMLHGKLLGETDPEAAATEALEMVQKGYDTREGEDGGSSRSPETEGQREFVRAFARRYLHAFKTD